MVQVYNKTPFSKQNWNSDNFGFRSPVIQRNNGGNECDTSIVERVEILKYLLSFCVYDWVLITAVPREGVFLGSFLIRGELYIPRPQADVLVFYDRSSTFFRCFYSEMTGLLNPKPLECQSCFEK